MPMLLLRIFGALALLSPLSLFGQTPDLPSQNEGQAAPNIVPRPSADRGVPALSGNAQGGLQSFLDPQSEMDRRRMLDKQQRTFQLEIDGRYAKALKAYCDTGYGDERCLRPELPRPIPVPLPAPAVSGAAGAVPKVHLAATEGKELPTIVQISGFGDDLSAVLVFANGKRLRVLGPGPAGPRSQLPDGEIVSSIHPGEVLVTRPGEAKSVPLLFQGTAGLGASE